MLAAVNLRTAVGALSPLVGVIDADIGLGALGAGFLGMLPPLCFAVFGLLTPLVSRRYPIEAVLIVAIAAMLGGHLVRAAAGGFPQLAIGSAICFAGMGAGNVLLPPLVKKYFPDRVGLMTSLYATVMAVSTLFPPLVAVPVAEGSSWHVSLGLWGLFAGAALVPWVIQLLAERRRGVATGLIDIIGEPSGRVPVARSWIAWALVVVLMESSIGAYSMFAWLPSIMQDVAGASAAEAGLYLSLFAAMGIPTAILVPMMVTRFRRIDLVVCAGGAFFVAGYLGLVLAPTTLPVLWVALAGMGPLLFPMALTLINVRSATQSGALALSGFVQGAAYVAAGLGPLGMGLLHDATGSWTPGLLLLAALCTLCIPAGLIVARNRTVESELRGRGLMD
ncbi:MFS transporter [Mycetocola reblochoni]|nr:MFS transporter [Mycetocola reblochoni]